jgi:hypothetical protein
VNKAAARAVTVIAVFVLLAYTISLGSYVPAPGTLALPIELAGAAVSQSVALGAR